MAYDPAIQSFVQRTLDDVSFGCKFLPTFVVERRTPTVRELLDQLKCVQHNPNANSSVHLANIQLAGETYSIHYAKQIDNEAYQIDHLNRAISLYYDPSLDPDVPPGIAVSAINAINELKVIKDDIDPANLSKIYGTNITCHTDILDSITILDCDEILNIPYSIAQKISNISIDEVIHVAKVDLTSETDGVENTETYDILCKKIPNGQPLEASMGDTPQQIVLSYPAVEFNMDKHDISNLLSNISIYKDINNDVQASIEPHGIQLDCSEIHVNFDSDEIRKCATTTISSASSTDTVPQISIIEQIQNLDEKENSDLDIIDIVVKIALVDISDEEYKIYFKTDANGTESVYTALITDGNGNADNTHIIYSNSSPQDDSELKAMLSNIRFYRENNSGNDEIRVQLDGGGEALNCNNGDFNEYEPQTCLPIDIIEHLPIIEQINKLSANTPGPIEIAEVKISSNHDNGGCNQANYPIHLKYGDSIDIAFSQMDCNNEPLNPITITHNDTESLTIEELSDILSNVRIYGETDNTGNYVGELHGMFEPNGTHLECEAALFTQHYVQSCTNLETHHISIAIQVSHAHSSNNASEVARFYNFPVLIAYMDAADSLFPGYRIYVDKYGNSENNFTILDSTNKTITVHSINDSVNDEHLDSSDFIKHALTIVFINADESDICYKDLSQNHLEVGQPCYNEQASQQCLSLHVDEEKYQHAVISNDIITTSGETLCHHDKLSIMFQIQSFTNIGDSIEIAKVKIEGNPYPIIFQYAGTSVSQTFDAEVSLDANDNPTAVLITYSSPNDIKSFAGSELSGAVKHVRIFMDDGMIDAAYVQNVSLDNEGFLNSNHQYLKMIDLGTQTEPQWLDDINNVGPLHLIEQLRILKVEEQPIKIADITFDNDSSNYSLQLKLTDCCDTTAEIKDSEIIVGYQDLHSFTENGIKNKLKTMRFYHIDYDDSCNAVNSNQNIVIKNTSDNTKMYGGGNLNSYINCPSVNFLQADPGSCSTVRDITKLSILQQIYIAMDNANNDGNTLTTCDGGYKFPTHIAKIKNDGGYLAESPVYIKLRDQSSDSDVIVSTETPNSTQNVYIQIPWNYTFTDSKNFADKVLTSIYYTGSTNNLTNICYYDTINNGSLPSDNDCHQVGDRGCIDLYTSYTSYDSDTIQDVGLASSGTYCSYE